MDRDLALARRAQPDHVGRVGPVLRSAVAPGGAVERRAPLGLGGVAEGVDLLPGGMRWLGLDWDGDAISQASRAARHAEVAHAMLENGT
ncbi:MAG: hypothetical protein AAFW46_19710, partial [Pseudomonadota bacterium]